MARRVDPRLVEALVNEECRGVLMVRVGGNILSGRTYLVYGLDVAEGQQEVLAAASAIWNKVRDFYPDIRLAVVLDDGDGMRWGVGTDGNPVVGQSGTAPWKYDSLLPEGPPEPELS